MHAATEACLTSVLNVPALQFWYHVEARTQYCPVGQLMHADADVWLTSGLKVPALQFWYHVEPAGQN